MSYCLKLKEKKSLYLTPLVFQMCTCYDTCARVLVSTEVDFEVRPVASTALLCCILYQGAYESETKYSGTENQNAGITHPYINNNCQIK